MRFDLRKSRHIKLIIASAALSVVMGCMQNTELGGPSGVSGNQFVPTAGMPGATTIGAAIKVQDRHTASLLAIPGVNGTGSGVSAQGEPVIVVFTEESGVEGIPTQIEGVAVKVETIGKVTAMQKKTTTNPAAGATCTAPNRAGRFARPVPIGVSAGHPSITAGTIGVRVKDSRGKLYLLSNNHVFANTNVAAVGDNILQPGPFDGGVNPGDAIGTLNKWTPIAFCAGSSCVNNKMDAAIASTTTALADRATPCDGYGTPAKTVTTPVANLQVKKYGRTTGLTTGTIAAVNVTIQVGYAGGVAQFSGQVYITTPSFIGGGDSGSLIVAASNNRPVALVFAGTSTAAFATPISAVLSQFGVTVDGV
jgi:hypothetical protein